jgi:predicted AlkP superfamily phosphohydrolase/phosphomutase
MPRAVLIGLDCASPRLLFGPLASVMPRLTALRKRGTFGTLRSTTPPITIPAWACMLSGRDPGELGLYGFRELQRDAYAMQVANADRMHAPWVWELARAAGKRTAALFVPLTYPVKPSADVLVSCLLTPSADSVHTHPAELAAQLHEHFGVYQPDVEAFRHADPLAVVEQLRAMTTYRFAVARHVWEHARPELMAMVDIGIDRLHHVLWRSLDTAAPDRDPDPIKRAAALGYLAHVDRELGRLLDELGDDVTVLVASDHGARPLRGAIAINEWLIDRGYLVLDGARPTTPTPLAQLKVNWSQTRAWAEGGYYARVYLNVAGRNPLGSIPPERFEEERRTLADEIAQITGPRGEPLNHRIATPQELYRAQRGSPPDLLVFFGDLDYRAAGTLGHGHESHGRIHLPHNDTGADACNHDWDGLFVHAGPGIAPSAQPSAWSIFDVTRTLLGALGVQAPSELLGTDRTLMQ